MISAFIKPENRYDSMTNQVMPTNRVDAKAVHQRSLAIVSAGYVPDGMTADSYKALKEKEKAAMKNLGRSGPRGFKSRSMASFVEAMERGEAGHLFQVEFAKEKVARGELKVEDIPYMQRGGNWDNSDIKGASNRMKWLASDKKYD